MKWAWRFFRASKRYDALLTGSERLALFVALMQSFVRGKRRVPHVLLECMWTLPQGRLARWRRRLLLRRVAEATDRIAVYARHQIDVYAKLFGIPRQKFVFIHSHSTLYGAAYAAVPGDYIFSGGYTNRDYRTLLEAVRELPYRIVACVSSKCALPRDMPANVEVFENLSEDDFNRLMAASAIVVVPLKGGVLEAGGRQVFQNAMTMGKAVIVTDSFATDYISNEVTGLLVPPGSPAQLRDAIVRLMRDRGLVLRLGQEAQKASIEFTPERFFEHLFVVIEGVLRPVIGTEPKEGQIECGTAHD
jgi:glycosyltransferase involved in cell wall biosynthesis